MVDWRDQIEAAAARIKGYARVTPVMQARVGGFDLAFKLENTQHTASFKARGAFNTLLSSDVPKAGVVAASGGNHGAAVGFAAAQLGYGAHIFVPELAGPSKIALVERTGATLHVVAGTYAEAFAAAQAHEAETGAMQIHAFDAEATVAGQGTLMREWEGQGLGVDTVLIAVGGGGLIAGALAWAPRAKVVAVEPEQAATLHGALANGAPTQVSVGGVAANALGAKQVGQICFDLARGAGTVSVLVSDAAITKAQRLIWQELRQHVEPAGATALAALISGAYVPAKDERIGVLICGANPAPDPFVS